MSAENQMPPRGAMTYVEFGSKDATATREFYSSLFGWQFNDGPGGYLMFQAPGGVSGGFAEEIAPSEGGALVYLSCEAITPTLAAIKAAGGQIAMTSMALPENWGHIGHFTDPNGNKLGLWAQEG